nr:putative histone deacetylase complex subunit cti6 [Aedes albopictus]
MQGCGGPDTDDMVQCDVCNKWHHFACVGVTKEDEVKTWSCAVCDTVTRALQILSTSDKTPKQVEAATEARSLNPIIPSDKQHTLQPPEGPSSKGIVKQPSLLKSIPERSAKGTYSVVSRGSSRSSVLKLELQKLEEERALEQMEAEKQRSYLNKKYDILIQLTTNQT